MTTTITTIEPAMRESDVQRSIIEYLAVVTPSTLVWAVPNASVRKRGGRAGNAVPGLRAGVYDLSLVFADGRFAAIEIKTARGAVSHEQGVFGRALLERGVPCCVARSVEDVRAFLGLLNIKTREAA